MKISGLQKTTLLDYPGKVAATVFTPGCNFRCPFCHNSLFVLNGGEGETIPEDKFFSFLDKRKGILEGVCITGGEPLMQEGLKEFILKIKERGLLVKLDTNGSFPERLKELAGCGIIDYVAMDIKNSPARYAETSGITGGIMPEINESVEFLLSGTIDYEFRTTAVRQFHTAEDFIEIAKWIKGAKRYFIQPFEDSEGVIKEGLSGFSPEELCGFADAVREYVPSVSIRGL